MAKDYELGKRIAWLRKNSGLEQKEAAEKIGIIYGTYQPYEYGKRPSWRKIEDILSFYQCNKSWLLTGEGVPYPDKPGEEPTSELNQPEVILSDDLLHITPAVRILNEATADAKVELSAAQKKTLIKIIQDEFKSAEIKADYKVKEIIKHFKSSDTNDG